MLSPTVSELYRVYNIIRVKPEEELTDAYMEFNEVCASIEALFNKTHMLSAEGIGSYFMKEVERIMCKSCKNRILQLH